MIVRHLIMFHSISHVYDSNTANSIQLEYTTSLRNPLSQPLIICKQPHGVYFILNLGKHFFRSQQTQLIPFRKRSFVLYCDQQYSGMVQFCCLKKKKKKLGHSSIDMKYHNHGGNHLVNPRAKVLCKNHIIIHFLVSHLNLFSDVRQ